jgi:hypothetical protein
MKFKEYSTIFIEEKMHLLSHLDIFEDRHIMYIVHICIVSVCCLHSILSFVCPSTGNIERKILDILAGDTSKECFSPTLYMIFILNNPYSLDRLY